MGSKASTCVASAAIKAWHDDVAEHSSTTTVPSHWMFIRRDAPGNLKRESTPSTAKGTSIRADPTADGRSVSTTTAAVVAGMAVSTEVEQAAAFCMGIYHIA